MRPDHILHLRHKPSGSGLLGTPNCTFQPYSLGEPSPSQTHMFSASWIIILSRELNRGNPRVLVHGLAAACKVEGCPEGGAVGLCT